MGHGSSASKHCSDLLDRLHSSRQGTAATRQCARDAVVWDSTVKDIENCETCLKDANKRKRKPLDRQYPIHCVRRLARTSLLTMTIIIDVHYLLLVNYLSDLIEFEKMLNVSFESAIDICKGHL